MAIARRDDASNSRSDRTVSRIQGRGAGSEAVRVTLSDGSSFFASSSELASERLVVGSSIDGASVARLAASAESLRARDKALGLLAARDHSRSQLETKLGERGFSPESIGFALDSLAREGSLDDARFARAWLDSRLKRAPSGRSHLYAGLLRSGVSRECAGEALESLSDEEERAALRAAAARLLRRPGMGEEKLIATLVRRGFPFPAVRHFVRENLADRL